MACCKFHVMHDIRSYWSMATSNLDDNTALSRYSAWLWSRSLIHHSPLQLTCMALLLNSHFVLLVFQPRLYPPWAGLLVEDHLWQSGPSMAAILGPGGTIYGNIICRRWSGGTSCGGRPTAAWQATWDFIVCAQLLQTDREYCASLQTSISSITGIQMLMYIRKLCVIQKCNSLEFFDCLDREFLNQENFC